MRHFLLWLCCLLALTACEKPQTPKVPFANTDITGLDYAKGFSLTDHNGKLRTLADFKGKVVVIFFWLYPLSGCVSNHLVRVSRS